MSAFARNYHFDGSMSEEVLRSYLSRSRTTMYLLTSHGDLDASRPTPNCTASWARVPADARPLPWPGSCRTNDAWGIGNYGQKQGGAIFKEMMRWLWRDQRVSTEPIDTVARSFRASAAPPAGIAVKPAN